MFSKCYATFLNNVCGYGMTDNYVIYILSQLSLEYLKYYIIKPIRYIGIHLSCQLSGDQGRGICEFDSFIGETFPGEKYVYSAQSGNS